MQSLKKELKKARLFEVQRISKRIKALKRKRGSESQVQKNQRKANRLQEELELIKRTDLSELADQLIENTDGEQCLDINPPTDLNERAKWRIRSSKPLQKFMRTNDIGTADIRTVEIRTIDVNSRTIAHDGVTIATESLSDSSSNNDDTDNDNVTSTDDEDTPLEEDQPIRAQRYTSERTIDSIFVSSLATSNKGTKTKRNPSIKSNDGSRKTKKNRLGQRTRRRLWLSKYGDRATHLKKDRGACSKRAHTTSRSQTQTLKAQPSQLSSTNTAAALHPSWQASRIKKQRESSIEQFQGKKTVFADSDSG